MREIVVAWESTAGIAWALPDIPSDPIRSPADYWTWLCSGCTIDPNDWDSLDTLAETAGLPDADCALGARLALAHRLVMPDGSISEDARLYLERLQTTAVAEA